MSICTSNVTSGFIDLATFDEIEKYLYGGPDATAYFVRETRKSTWFTQVPVVLTNCSGAARFNATFSVNISRAGDYLLQTWLRICIPAVSSKDDTYKLFWTPNLMHNLVEECCITFNDLVAARFDSNHLDFWTAFTVPASKRVGYDNMIGNVTSLTQPNKSLPAATLNLPLPFFYSRDSGVALPTAALPYNEMRITFRLRPLGHLLSKIDTSGPNAPICVSASDDLNETDPQLTRAQVWANYAIVSNDERKRMACAPRDILIEQAQTAHHQTFLPTKTDNRPQYDLRYSHAVKVLFFAAQNTTHCSVRSNYTTASPVGNEFGHKKGHDPIIATSLVYENTARLSDMGSDYFSCVNPYYHAVSVPSNTGYHSYSYSLDFNCLDPMGSTNYGKLTNVSIIPEASTKAVDSKDNNQTYEFVCTCVNNNIIRISGGALGFPVL